MAARSGSWPAVGRYVICYLWALDSGLSALGPGAGGLRRTQEVFEGAVSGGHRDRVPRTRNRVSQRARQLDAPADGRFDDLSELGGMRRGQEHAAGIWLIYQPILQREPGDSTMGIEHVPVLPIDMPNLGNDLRILVGETHDVLTQCHEIAVVERLHALEIARRTNVHGVCHRRDRWTRLVDARLQIFRHSV